MPLEDPHRPYVDDVDVPVRRSAASRMRARARGDRRLVRLGLDAVRPVARAVRERGRLRASASPPTTSARRSTRRAAGSTRCSPSRRCSSTARRTSTVVCLGLIPDAEGQKMSQVARQHRRAVGRHRPLRRRRVPLVLLHVQAAVGRLPLQRRTRSARRVRLFLRQLWNTYALPTTATRPTARAGGAGDRPRPLDPARGWARRSRRSPSAWTPTTPRRAGRAIAAFVDDLSNWYVRRSRRRFWDGDPAAFATLRDCLRHRRQLLAPFTPFVADEIYDNLDGAEPSVHLTDWPEPGERDGDLEVAMAVARETVRLGLVGARPGEGQAAPAAARGGRRRRRARARRRSSASPTSCATSSTSRTLRFVDAGRRARLLRGQAQLPHARPALRQGDAAGRGRGRGARPGARRDGAARRADRRHRDRRPRPRARRRRPAARDARRSRATSSSARARTRSRSSSRSTTSCAARASRARSSTPSRTRARPPASQVEDRIALTLGGDAELLDAARAHEAYVAGETLAVAVAYDGDGAGEPATIEGRELRIGVARAGGASA